MSTAIIILAAGQSARLGSPKQLLEFKGKTLLQHAIDEAKGTGCDHIVVVLGANAEEIREELDDPDIVLLQNNQWEDGMSSSIRCGIHHLLDRGGDGTIIMVCDQPHADRHLLKKLLHEHKATMKPIVASEYGGKPGTPAFFHRSVFDSLLSLKGDKGAKQMILERKEMAAFVGFPSGITDIDTPGDYEALVRNNK